MAERWVTPREWTARGEALAVEEGRPITVFQGIPGERALVRRLGGGQHSDAAYWVKADRPDPHRVPAPCDRYVPCGGCALMHLDTAGQERARRALVGTAIRDAVARYAAEVRDGSFPGEGKSFGLSEEVLKKL